MPPPNNTSQIHAERMADLMAGFEPFETAPHLAVAVSGGPDSMALALLANEWVRERGGRVTALTVDHGLRPGSDREAVRVTGWLASRGIAHEILPWHGPKPDSGVQAKARAARYRLLTDWCRDANVLHLLLGHQREDQAETFMLRLASGSGVDGLAAMSGIIEMPHVRLLRPLLTVPRGDVLATLKGHGQDWIEDPSNADASFTRVRIRQSFAEEGASVEQVVQTASRMARARMALEAEASRQMASCCRVYPSGYARLDAAALFTAEDEISLRVLARVLMCVGAKEHAPGLTKLERLHDQMKTQGNNCPGATLSGCRVVAEASGMILICREQRGLPDPMRLDGGQVVHWDGRFTLRLDTVPKEGVQLAPLGESGWNALGQTTPEIRSISLPRAVALTLPCLVDDKGIAAVAHLYRRSAAAPAFDLAGFHPPQTLSAAGFVVAN